jgi:hypothetical protein
MTHLSESVDIRSVLQHESCIVGVLDGACVEGTGIADDGHHLA